MTKNKKVIPSKEEIKTYENLSEEEKDRRSQETLDMMLGAFENYLEKEEWDEKIMLLFKRARIIEVE
jgi:hypothetical protein